MKQKLLLILSTILLSLSIINPSHAADSVYSSPASPPSIIPVARVDADLLSVASGNHKAVNFQLGSPAQSLRLIIDTGSSDLLILNSTFCARVLIGSTRPCYNPTLSTSQSSLSLNIIEMNSYSNDGELLTDPSAQFGFALGNLPVSLIGSSSTILLGVTDFNTGFPTQSDQQIEFLLTSPELVYVAPVPYIGFSYSLYSWNTLTDVDGIIGLSYDQLSLTAANDRNRSVSPFHSLLSTVSDETIGDFFSLDYFNNRLLLGGIDETWRDSLLWSYPAAITLNSYHSFLLWDLSVCGVNLQSQLLNSNIQPLSAIIDTGSTCLSLPAELFDSLITWIPVTCSDSPDGLQPSDEQVINNKTNIYGGANNDPESRLGSASNSNININPHIRYCWLATDLTTISLPSITFRLSASNINYADNDGRQPQKIIISLNDLLSSTQKSSSLLQPQRLCLVRTDTINSPGNFISFGSRVLTSIITVYSLATHQIGMMNYPATIRTPSNNSCIVPIKCVGQQSHNKVYNFCVEPNCSDYYFFTLNKSTHSCQLNSGFHVLAAILIILVLVTELSLNEGIIHTAKKIQGIQRTNRRQVRR